MNLPVRFKRSDFIRNTLGHGNGKADGWTEAKGVLMRHLDLNKIMETLEDAPLFPMQMPTVIT